MTDKTLLPEGFIKQTPTSVTLITTYRCTAACRECCFECSPKIENRLSLSDMKFAIKSSFEKFPDLKIIVFTGGECFMLGKDLFEAISYAASFGLKTRCVTNAYWGRSPNKAIEIAEKLRVSGITEINISTGLEHQEWVSQESVINAAEALISKGISTLITVEKDKDDTSYYRSLVEEKRVIELLCSRLFSVQKNNWMPFHKNHIKRSESISNSLLYKGCDQLYNNTVITPHKKHSACCGLTMEYIPEMKIGDLHSDLFFNYQEHKNDFLKVWIFTDGPYKIVEKLMGKNYLENKHNIPMTHPCQVCAYMHQDPCIREEILKNSLHHSVDVIGRLHAKNTITLLNLS